MSSISQPIYEVFEHQKTELLLHLLETLPDCDKVMVFVHTRDGVHALTSALSHAGVRADSIHGNKKTELRDRALKELNEGKLRVIVSTDAVVRDLDTSCVENVVYFDFPELVDDYSRRAQSGRVITLAVPNDSSLAKLENALGYELSRKVAADFTYATQPVRVKPPRKEGGKSRGLHSKPLQNKKPKFKNKRGRK